MSRAPVFYQETRLSPSPASPSQLFHISTTGEPTGAGRKRGFDEISGLDEDSYARKHLATEGSVFFRRKERSPRSFLWRVLEDRKVLEIQCVDLVHDTRSSKGESWLTYRLHLPSEIVRNGVAFADPDEHDALEAFVITASSHDLYTFTLKRDVLTRETVPKDIDGPTYFKRYASNTLNFRYPYRMVAVSSLELLVSLNDGGLMRFERQPNESGAQWRETFFTEGKWGDTLRGLIPFKRHQTVRYGNVDLEPNTIAAIAKSPDGRYIWTVTLEHELKVWSAKTGKPVVYMELLNQKQPDDEKKRSKHIMGSEQGTLLQILDPAKMPGGRAVVKDGSSQHYYVVVHSPKEHQFKFYRVRPETADESGLDFDIGEIQKRRTLIPPIDELMNTNIWHLEDFHVSSEFEWKESQIWIRARSGTLCRTFTLKFNFEDDDGDEVDPTPAWQTGWTVVDTGVQTIDALRTSSDFPGDLEGSMGVAMTEKWLEFLFYPGRFSTASIETALYTYRKGRGLPPPSRGKGLKAPELPLKERLSQAIAAKIILKRLRNDQPNYDKYQADIQAQWRTFYALLSHLHTRRHDSIGFAFDTQDELAWSMYADYVASIRASNHFELLCLNENLLQEDRMEEVDEAVSNNIFNDEDARSTAQLLSVIRGFSKRLSPDFRERFKSYVLTEAIAHESGDKDRNTKSVLDLYASTGFEGEVKDDDWQALENSAESLGSLGELNDQGVLGLLEKMTTETSSVVDDHKSLVRYGEKFTVASTQETLEHRRVVMLDLLSLIVFMYGDLDTAELHPDFVSEIGPMYEAIIVKLKHNEMLSWLGRNMIVEGPRQHRSSKNGEAHTVTLLDAIFMADWQSKSPPGTTMAQKLTRWSKDWTDGPDMQNNWDGTTGHILAVLIKEQWYGLAEEFLQFLSQAEESSNWLRYLEGRLYLAIGDFAQASLKFRAAAEGMAEATKIGGTDTALLLDADEKNYFGEGQDRFYQHVAALFEKLKVFSYAADFSKLALEQLESDNSGFARSMAAIDRQKAESPYRGKADHTVQEIEMLKSFEARKNEIVNRLFTALVQTGRFKEAFDALVEVKDSPMRTANLGALIKACVAKEAVPTLLQLPFEKGDLEQDADRIISDEAKKSLVKSSSVETPYTKILYAFRTQRGNYRGAAEILYEHLERLRFNQKLSGVLDPENEEVVQAYVLLINTLACCGEQDGWLLAENVSGVGAKRRLVTIEDVRREYGAELDRRSDILQGRFPLVGGGDAMDVL